MGWIDLRFLAWVHLGFVVAVWQGFSLCQWLVVVDSYSRGTWYLDGFRCLVTRKVEEKKRKWIRDDLVLDVFVWLVGKKVKEKKISCGFFFFFWFHWGINFVLFLCFSNFYIFFRQGGIFFFVYYNFLILFYKPHQP